MTDRFIIMSDEGETGPTITPELIPNVEMDEEFSITFSMTGVKQVVSVKITPLEENKNVIIDPPRLYGSYYDPFTIDENAIRYRQGNSLKSTDEWDKIPSGKLVDMYYWRAPNPLLKTYKYLVEIEYIPEDPPSEGGSSRTVGTKNIATKEYSHVVSGRWDRWQRLLREKIQERDKKWQA